MLFPAQLVLDLMKYIETERARVVEAANRRLGALYRDPGVLFLNGVDANDRDVGRPMKAATISRRFTRAVVSCGLFLAEEDRFLLRADGSLVRDESSGEPLTESVKRPAHTYHDLRHTFAVVQYFIRVRRGDKNPLGTVRSLLRHTLSQTTADLYLAWMDFYERELSDLLSELYADLDTAAASAA